MCIRVCRLRDHNLRVLLLVELLDLIRISAVRWKMNPLSSWSSSHLSKMTKLTDNLGRYEFMIAVLKGVQNEHFWIFLLRLYFTILGHSNGNWWVCLFKTASGERRAFFAIRNVRILSDRSFQKTLDFSSPWFWTPISILLCHVGTIKSAWKCVKYMSHCVIDGQWWHIHARQCMTDWATWRMTKMDLSNIATIFQLLSLKNSVALIWRGNEHWFTPSRWLSDFRPNETNHPPLDNTSFKTMINT